MNTIIGFLLVAVSAGADVSHLNLHHPHAYQPRSSYDDVVDPVYPPLSDPHHSFYGYGYNLGLTSNEEYAADFPQSFDHQITGHEVNADLGAHTLDFQNQFNTPTADHKPIYESQEENYETPMFENTVFHQVPAPQFGEAYHHEFDGGAHDFSDEGASHHLQFESRSINSGLLFTPSTNYDSVYKADQHLQYTNSLLKKK